jgi:hypothetical protein
MFRFLESLTSRKKTTSSRKRTTHDILAIAQSLPEYIQLATLVGLETTNEAINATYDIRNAIANWPEDRLRSDMKKSLAKEVLDIQRGQQHIQAILEEAVQGFSILKNEKFLLKPAQYGATDQQDDYTKAVQWICFNSGTVKEKNNGKMAQT